MRQETRQGDPRSEEVLGEETLRITYQVRVHFHRFAMQLGEGHGGEAELSVHSQDLDQEGIQVVAQAVKAIV